MKPASTSYRKFGKTRMMAVHPNAVEKISHREASALVDELKSGDLLLVNNSGTLPASFTGFLDRTGEALEIRLAAFRGTNAQDLSRWTAVVFGSGDWHMPTERRGLPPPLQKGDCIDINSNLSLEVMSVLHPSTRIIEIQFHAKDLIRELYDAGKAIQYSYHLEDLKIWDIQTLMSGIPISVEPPSTSFPLTWEMLFELKKKGIAIASILHSAGLSSTGDVKLDRLLPFNEYFEVPDATLELIHQTHKQGGRIIAVGTSVTRAVESALKTGRNKGMTDLKLGPRSQINGIDILITGMHEKGSSHGELVGAFCSPETLDLVFTASHAENYQSHEFGDWTMIESDRNYVSI